LVVLEPATGKIIRTAIHERRLLRFQYENKDRIVEPHDYGVYKQTLRLLAYQVGGQSSGKLPNWRWIDVPKMSDVQLLDKKFKGSRGDQSEKHHEWDEIFARVK
jgi:predicted DNA-binding transcriptional regulator YafY